MKKLLLGLTLVAFAFAPALQAGEGKTCDKNKADCSAQAKASCASSCASACAAAKAAAMKKAADPTAKGATLLAQK